MKIYHVVYPFVHYKNVAKMTEMQLVGSASHRLSHDVKI